MPRSVNPVPKFTNDANEPLAFGLMYFFDSGTNTPKVTYKDANLSIPNTHPVVLTASGELRNVIFEGSAKQILTDASASQSWEVDPVGVIDSTFGNPWSELIIYSLGEVVRGSDGIYYESVGDGNQGNDPVTTSGLWKLLFSLQWSAAITYQEFASVLGSDGILYTSSIAANIGNDPVSSPNEWANPATIDWSSLVTYGEDANVRGSDGALYRSLIGSNLGNDPTSSPNEWIDAATIEFSALLTYAAGANITESDVMYYSKIAGNIGNLPSTSPTQWGIVAFQWSVDQTYGLNANVIGSDGVFYQSAIVNNVGNDPLISSSWASILSLAGNVVGTSVTPNTISTGTKTFTTQTGLEFAIGMEVKVTDNSDVNNSMSGTVSSYDNITTGVIVIEVFSFSGSGTISDWTIIHSLRAEGAGTSSFIASGAIGAGDSTILNADGTVSSVAGVAQSITNSVNTGNTAISNFVVGFDPVKSVAVAVWGSGNDLVCSVGVITGSSLSWGTAVTLTLGMNPNGLSIVYHAAEGNFIVVHHMNSAAFGVAISTSGSVPTFGTDTSILATVGTNTATGIAYDPDTESCMAIIRVTGDIRAMSLTLSGLVITAGGAAAIGVPAPVQSTDLAIGVCYDTNVNKYLICASSSGNIVYAATATSDGSTVTTGGIDMALVISSTGENASCAFIDGANQVVVLSAIDGTTGVSKAAMVTINPAAANWTFTVGSVLTTTVVTAINNGNLEHAGVIADPANTFYTASEGGATDNTDAAVTSFTVDGTTITQDASVLASGSACNPTRPLYYDSNSGETGLLYSLAAGDVLTVAAVSVPFTNVTAANFLGFSDGIYADAGGAQIVGFAGTTDRLSGLAFNSQYYVQEDGTLDTAPATIETVFAGRAVSETNLVVKEPSA